MIQSILTKPSAGEKESFKVNFKYLCEAKNTFI